MMDLQVNAIRGVIAQLPSEEQVAIGNAAEYLRTWLQGAPQTRMMAMALVGAEMAGS